VTDVVGQLWRWEVEFKAYRANRVWKQLREKTLAAPEAIADTIRATVALWWVTRGYEVPFATGQGIALLMDVGAKITGDEITLNWYSNSVAPSVRRLVRKGKLPEVLVALGLQDLMLEWCKTMTIS